MQAIAPAIERGGKSGGKYGELGGSEGAAATIRFSNLLIPLSSRPSSNPSLSANYLSHGISCRLGNAENRAILSVLVSHDVSYLLTQSHSRGGTSRFWCIGGQGEGFMPLKECMND